MFLVLSPALYLSSWSKVTLSSWTNTTGGCERQAAPLVKYSSLKTLENMRIISLWQQKDLAHILCHADGQLMYISMGGGGISKWGIWLPVRGCFCIRCALLNVLVCVCVCFEVLTLVALERWGLNEVLKTYSGPSDDLHVYLWATVSSHRESNTGNMFYMHHSFPTVPAFSSLLPLPCFSKCVFYSSQAFLEWFYGKQGWFNDLSSAGG